MRGSVSNKRKKEIDKILKKTFNLFRPQFAPPPAEI
jgi:hypothetical protein